MSTISAGKLIANSLVHLGDRTGDLVFQTNGTTTALTLDDTQNATFAGNVTVAGNLTVNGTTTSFGDNDIINLGDGNDLQIYHDGSNSYVKDNGTGSLILSGTININSAYTLPGADGTAGYALTTDGAGTLSFNKVGTTPTLVDSDTTAVAGDYYVATVGGITITLPAGPDSGDYVEIHDGTGAAATSNITVGRNGSSIAGAAEDFTLDVNFAKLHMVYVGGSVGWTV